MNGKGNAPAAGGTATRAEDKSCRMQCFAGPPGKNITSAASLQERIVSALGCGAASARTAGELAILFGCHRRDISAAIERARVAGVPICASTDNGCPGCFLPASTSEIAGYRRSLERRVAAVSRTLKAIEYAHDRMTGQQRFDLEVTP